MDRVLFSHNRDDYETPQWLFDELNEEFHFTLDVAADGKNSKCFVHLEDALNIDWMGTSFCNPPYSQWQKFVKQGYESHLKHNSTVVMLLPARTDTKAFHKYIWPHAEVRFLKGRLKFTIDGKPILDKKGRPQSAPFPSMVVIFR